MRLIDAIGLKQALAVSAILKDKKTIEQIIDEQPTIEPQPEHKHGKWVFVRDEEAGNALYMCSACGKGDIHAPEVKVSYCWNCGAEMTQDREDK